jgi:hypothetical protein
MNPLAIIGAFIITLALLSYGIGSISVQRFKLVTPAVLVFLTLGVILDFTAVGFMIIGSTKGIFTLHGILGYSAILTMLLDTFFIWRFYLKNGFDVEISKNIVTFSKYAYSWWVIAYLTGSLLVIWK